MKFTEGQALLSGTLARTKAIKIVGFPLWLVTFFIFRFPAIHIFTQTILNDLDISMSHLDQLVRDPSLASAVSQHYVEQAQAHVKNSLLTFSRVKGKITSTLRVGYLSHTSNDPIYALMIRLAWNSCSTN